jgi:hypothetical protein
MRTSSPGCASSQEKASTSCSTGWAARRRCAPSARCGPADGLVVYGHYATLSQGHKSRSAWIEWYAATGAVALWGLLSPGRRVSAYRIQKLREGHQTLPVSGGRAALPVGGGPRHPKWFREDFRALLELLREQKIHPVVAERLPFSEARRAHELLESSAAKGKLVLVP